ncbi:TlpA family protein disulfide reductase [Nesterenkonia jeotgali]|uniref:Peroxiredoxin n=1 Tax=Nesterenkonia jeotgali TaxID=317018 RepID=A0A0W8IKL4_9MICC|nr:TlpA disulfide reductase family protein [Nesterenkonia jeotgali]KUG60631.1 thiol-disulfide isomerase [Nesterenkonia jeotgali]MBA8922516.1 peroxiredoxin [Nesterenkonia jeotgali]
MTVTEKTTPRTSRLSALAAVALASMLALAGCSSANDELSQRAQNDGTNYVAGDGSVQELAVADRGEPVQFESTLFDGSQVGPERWEGEVTVINFWYAACAPCRVEAPDLADLHAEFEDEGVQFYGVNTRDTQPTAEAFERTFGIEYPSMEDRSGEVMLAMTDYVPPSAVPTTLVLDKQGRVSARILGIAEPATLRALIDTALDEDSESAQP